jgi:integrase
MVRGVHIVRSTAERMTLAAALKRYTAEVTPTKRPSTQEGEICRAVILERHLGKYALTALTPEVIAHFSDMRLAGEDLKDENGKPIPRANNTVRLELALLDYLFTIAIKEWGVGLIVNPVMSIRRPVPGPGHNRRLTEDEEKRLLVAVDAYSNPMLRWIVRIALTTGMRASEILTLHRPQVDLKRLGAVLAVAHEKELLDFAAHSSR